MNGNGVAALLDRLAARPGRVVVALHVVFALLFVGSALTRGAHRGRLVAGDGLFYFAYLPSWVVDHDVDLTNQLETLRQPGAAPLKYEPTVTGKASSPYAIGAAVLDLPFFLVGHTLDRVLFGRADGCGWLAQGSVCLASMTYACVGALLLVRLLRRWFDPATALVATLAIELASSLVYYVVISPSYSHGASFCGVTAFMGTWLAVRERLSLRGAVALGAVAGLVTLVRWQDVVFVWVAALPLIARIANPASVARQRGSVAGFCLVATLAAALVFSPQLVVWKAIYGSWLTIPQGETWVRWSRPDVWATLASLDQGGFFTWTPVTLFACAGLWLFRKREPALVAGSIVALVLDLYVEATVHHGLGTAYGSRRLIGATVVLGIGFAALLDVLRRRRGVLATLVLSGTLVAWNGLLLAEYQWLVHAGRARTSYPTLRELVTHTPFRR